MHGSGDWEFELFDTSPEGAPAIVSALVAKADQATELPEDRVHCTYFWITDGDGSSSATSRCATRSRRGCSRKVVTSATRCVRRVVERATRPAPWPSPYGVPRSSASIACW